MPPNTQRTVDPGGVFAPVQPDRRTPSALRGLIWAAIFLATVVIVLAKAGAV
jgi:hypothetical protein